LALHQLALVPDHTLVIEDSSNGLLAATGRRTRHARDGFRLHAQTRTSPGLRSSSPASADPDGEQFEVLADPWNISPVGALTLGELARLTGHKEGGHE